MEIVNTVIAFANDHGLTTIVSLLLAQLALGVAVAIQDGSFRLNRLADICKKAAPLLITYAVVALLLKQPELTATLFGVIVAQTSGEILRNLVALVPALEGKIPASLLSAIEPSAK